MRCNKLGSGEPCPSIENAASEWHGCSTLISLRAAQRLLSIRVRPAKPSDKLTEKLHFKGKRHEVHRQNPRGSPEQHAGSSPNSAAAASTGRRKPILRGMPHGSGEHGRVRCSLVAPAASRIAGSVGSTPLWNASSCQSGKLCSTRRRSKVLAGGVGAGSERKYLVH